MVRWFGASVTYESINAETGKVEEITTHAQSLLSRDGIRFMYEDVVKNFMNFQAVGVIIVAMLGVGVADSSGLIDALIRKLVKVAPRKLLTYILVFIGVLSSIAADAGYLVLIPLGASAFLSMGRHPLAGLAASFAGVAAVFTANILIKPLDGILTGITNDAIHLVDPTSRSTSPRTSGSRPRRCFCSRSWSRCSRTSSSSLASASTWARNPSTWVRTCRRTSNAASSTRRGRSSAPSRCSAC